MNPKPTSLILSYNPKLRSFSTATNVTGSRAEMIAWCTSSNRAAAGWLVHGPGGLGKTRLMIPVAAELRRRELAGGFLSEPRAGAKVSEVRLREDALAQLIA